MLKIQHKFENELSVNKLAISYLLFYSPSKKIPTNWVISKTVNQVQSGYSSFDNDPFTKVHFL